MAYSNKNLFQGKGEGRELSDVEKRIIAAIKIYDEGINRYMLEKSTTFQSFMDTLKFYSSSLIAWCLVMELQRQVDHRSHIHIITSWMHDMIVKYFTYQNLPPEKQSDFKALLTEWRKIETRSNPRVYKEIREAAKALPDWNFPYADKLREIWEGDPNQAQLVWKKVWGE